MRELEIGKEAFEVMTLRKYFRARSRGPVDCLNDIT